MPNLNTNSVNAPTTKSGRERRTSEKAKALLDEATEKANNKKVAAQKSAERTEKRLHKKARTEEITRRRTSNQENRGPSSIQRADSPQNSIDAVADQDPSFTVQDAPVKSKVIAPRVNLVPQKGTVPRPPLVTTPSLGNRPSATSASHIQKLTPEKARYLLSLRNQVNKNLQDIRKPVKSKSTTTNSITREEDEDTEYRARRHIPSYRPYISSSTDHEEDEDTEHNARRTPPYVEEDDDNNRPEDFFDDTQNCDEDDNDNPGLDDIDDYADQGPMDIDDSERPGSRNRSPQVGQKRPRHDSDDSDPAQPDSDITKFRKAIKVKNSKGKPKADDWEPDVQEIISKAILFYEIRLATEGLFPDHMEEVTWAKVAWLDGCRICGLKIHHNSELIKILTCRGTHLRGVIKTKARALVESTYGFEVSGDDAVKGNRKKVERLKDALGFVYRKLGNGDRPNKGLYENSIIQRVVNQVWFAQRQFSPGVQFTEFFSPFPDPALAATLAAIENSIDEWGNGNKTDIHFTAAAYKPVYEEHLKKLDKFEEHTKDYGILPKILQRLHDNGRIFAKADPLAKQHRDLPTSAYDAAILEFQNRNGDLSNAEDGDSD